MTIFLFHDLCLFHGRDWSFPVPWLYKLMYENPGQTFSKNLVSENQGVIFFCIFRPDIFLSCKFTSLYVKVFNEWIHTLKPRFFWAPCRIQSLSLMTLIPVVYDFLTENFSLCILLHSTKIISVLPPNSPPLRLPGQEQNEVRFKPKYHMNGS